MNKLLHIIILFTTLNISTSYAQVTIPVKGAEVSSNLKFYPNPAVSFINFEFDHTYDKSYTLYIYNFIGKKVVELKFTEQKITVPLPDFYRGVYIFQFRNKQGNIVESGKFQVVK